MQKTNWILGLAAAATLVSGSGAEAAVTGAGSSFVYPVLSRWAADFKKAGGDEINYQSVGSGAGIAQIKAATVDFGASDKPLTPDELQAAGLVQFPVVVGGIVPVINLSGLRPGRLHLTGPVLAGIFAGQVKKWNDPVIARLNPGLKLPNVAISVVHRSDGSGTTYNFTHYLSQVSKGWKDQIGEGTTVNWPTGLGGKGNEGVANYVKQVSGSIGYVEYAYALQNRMSHAVVQNRAGRYVQPNAASFSAAAATVDWAKSSDFYQLMTNAPGTNAWPIAATTWVMMYKQPKNAATSAAARKFFNWSLTRGQKQALALDYVPLPATLVKRIQTYIAGNIK
ncbi:MAG: phosphate ABC transporter substrate-binding protein PstS [Sphingomicrobium sp.]